MRHDPRELAAIFIGGSAGALTRALLVEAFPPTPGQWPWVTLIVNVAGAFALGYLMVWLPLVDYRRPLLGTGVCGALTTFSTMQLELLDMLDADRIGLALGYASVSVIVGFAAVAVASAAGRRARRAGAA